MADQINRQESGSRWQLGAVHQGASGRRILAAAGSALEQLAGAVANDAVFRSLAASDALPGLLRIDVQCVLLP